MKKFPIADTRKTIEITKSNTKSLIVAKRENQELERLELDIPLNEDGRRDLDRWATRLFGNVDWNGVRSNILNHLNYTPGTV